MMPEKAVADVKYSSGEFFRPVPGARYKYDYNELLSNMNKLPVDKRRATYQWLAQNDLFFLLYFGMGRIDLNHPIGAPFFVDRCLDVESTGDNTLDLWARDHRKTTIITQGKTIQEILRNPEVTVGLFSHNRPIAKSILQVIRQYLQSDTLVSWFPKVLYENPAKDAPNWGLDSGVTVKRQSNRAEATVEAWGLVDGMPTQRHFDIRVYDDLVTEQSVTTEDQIEKTRSQFQMSHNIGTTGGRKWVIGTRYSYGDLYGELIADGKYLVRIHTIYGGTAKNGNLVFLTEAQAQQKLEEQGPYIFACQQLQNPVPEEDQKFKISWLGWYDRAPGCVNKYIVCDPASEKKRGRGHDPDYTVMWVVGFAPLGYVYLLDGVRGRYNLEERWSVMKELVARWEPNCVGYERYTKDSDIEHFQYRMQEDNFVFKIVPLGGQAGKADRIARLVPIFFQQKMMFPRQGIMKFDKERNRDVNLVDILIEDELKGWPYAKHDDMLDCLSRIENRTDLGVIVPHQMESMSSAEEEVIYNSLIELDEEVCL